MAVYLIHQMRDGAPMGVHSETDAFYFPPYENRKPYGEAVRASRGSDTAWAEWAEAQASKSPGPGGMWDTVVAPEAPLDAVLEEVKRTMVIPEDS